MRACNRCGKWEERPIPTAMGPYCEPCHRWMKKERENYEQWRHKPDPKNNQDAIDAANHAEAMCRTGSQPQ